MSKRKNRQKQEVQPARLTPDMMRMLATAANDITIPQYGDVLRPQDETLLAKGGAKGIRLYEEVRRDGHALAVLGKRVDKVLAREWIVEAASEDARDVQARELVERVLRSIAFDQLCRDLLGATLFGFSAAEIEWGIRDAETVPVGLKGHNQARFAFDLDWRPRLLTREQPSSGIALPERKFIVHRHDADGSDPYGRGLGRVLFWHVLFKREGVSFWLHFLEKFASPTPVGKYPIGTPPSEQDKLLHHLQSLVQNGALTVPIGSDVSFLESSGTGRASYEGWCRYWDEQTSVAVLGETLSTTLNGQGARAATETHAEVSDGVADADADMLSTTLNETLVRWIVEFNMPGARPPTVWRPRPKNGEAEERSKSVRADRQKKDINNLFDMAAKGFRPARGIEEALTDIVGEDVVADDALRARFGRRPVADDPAAPEFAARDDHDHGIGGMVDRLEAAAQPVIDGWLATIRAEIARAAAAGEDMAALSGRLLALSPELTVDPLGEIVAAGLTLAELTGRSQVLDEAAADDGAEADGG